MPGRRERDRIQGATRTNLLIVGGALLAVLSVTVVVLVIPPPRFEALPPIVPAVADAISGSVALVAAALVYGRYRTGGTGADLLLAAALLLFGLSDLGLSVVQQLLDTSPDLVMVPWASMIGRTIAAVTLLAAALWTPSGRHRPIGGWVLLSGVAVVVIAISVSVTVAAPAIATRLPLPIDLTTGAGPSLLRHPLATGLQVAGLAAFGGAAAGFGVRSYRTGERHLTWLAAAAIFGAASRMHYLLFPTFPIGLYYSGDLLRTGFIAIVAVVAARELEAQWRQAATARALEERRVIARDLHDGLAQDLAFVTTTTSTLAQRTGDTTLRQVAASAQRALDEARRAITHLGRPAEESLADGLAAAVEDVAHRWAATVVLDLDDRVETTPVTAETLVRIAREAVGNAARHADPNEVTVMLRGIPDGLRLCVEDDGAGFDPATVRAGFGLTSMRERAAAIGATLEVRSEPGSGTTVEVVVS